MATVEDAIKGLLSVEVLMAAVELRDQRGLLEKAARRRNTAALRRKTAASGVQKISGTPSGEIRTSTYSSSTGIQICRSSPGARVS